MDELRLAEESEQAFHRRFWLNGRASIDKCLSIVLQKNLKSSIMGQFAYSQKSKNAKSYLIAIIDNLRR